MGRAAERPPFSFRPRAGGPAAPPPLRAAAAPATVAASARPRRRGTDRRTATSEFEIASLDYQAATLAIREVGLWIAGAHVAIGVLQAAVVGYGIHAMIRANRDRARQVDAQASDADRRHADAQARAAERHAENMRRLDVIAEEQAEQRRAAAASLDAIVEEQADQRRAAAAQTRALEALLDRIAPAPAQPGARREGGAP